LFATDELCAVDDDSFCSAPSLASDSSDEESMYGDLDDCINAAQSQNGDLFPIASLIRSQQPPKKKPKTVDLKPIAFVRFNARGSGKPKPITLRALIDTGASASLVLTKHAKKLKIRTDSSTKTVWTTPNGKLSTSKRAKAKFTIPEIHDNRLIEWNLHVTDSLGAYDMIIGRDIMSDLKMDIKFSTNTIEWDGHEMPLKECDASFPEAYYVRDSTAVDEATQRLKGILDAKYEAADIRAVCDDATHLTQDEQGQLFDLLTEYEELFDGTLGVWTGSEVQLDMKPDIKPYHARAFPIPRVHVETLKMEVQRLCDRGVLKRVNRSEWAAPTFIIPKKDGSVRFICDFRDLTKRIRRTPLSIP
jgi:predicted aspartyl protease